MPLNESPVFLRHIDELIQVRKKALATICSGDTCIPSAFLDPIERLRALLAPCFHKDLCRLTIPGIPGDYVFREPYLLPSLLQDLHCIRKPGLHSPVLDLKDNATPDFILSDRDGTLISQEGKFCNSVQSLSDAMLLHRLFSVIPGVVVSASPLFEHGLSDLMLNVPGDSVLAGSNGLECMQYSPTKPQTFRVDPSRQAHLDACFQRLKSLLGQEPAFSVFRFVGFGLQRRVGKVLVALQDARFPIPVKLSKQYRKAVVSVLREWEAEMGDLVDDFADAFIVRETDTSLSITDKQLQGLPPKDALKDILSAYAFSLQDKHVWVCGNTDSDLSMIAIAKSKGAQVTSLFVTDDLFLRKQVKAMSDKAYFFLSPDALMNRLSSLVYRA